MIKNSLTTVFQDRNGGDAAVGLSARVRGGGTLIEKVGRSQEAAPRPSVRWPWGVGVHLDGEVPKDCNDRAPRHLSGKKAKLFLSA